MTKIQNIPSTNRLKSNIKKLGLRFPVAEISEKTGFNKGSVSSYISGKIPPSIPFIEKLAEVYNLNLDDFKEEGAKVVKEDITGIYYPDVSAVAGLDSLQNHEFKKIPITIPLWGKGLTFINVFGESMYPKYVSGEIIGIKEIQLDLINYGYAYVVVLIDGEVYLKYIQKGKDNDHLLLKSENQKYEPREMHIKNIKRVYIVKGVITKTTM